MNWNEYFTDLSEAVSKKSKDPSTKVGAVIVDQNNTVVSVGYNGFVQGCDESKLSWERPHKYLYVIHAEMNALLFAKRDLRGTKMFLTDAPCDNCLKHCLQAGIREIYYKSADVMIQRGSQDQKNTVKKLIEATGAKVVNVTNGKNIEEEL